MHDDKEGWCRSPVFRAKKLAGTLHNCFGKDAESKLIGCRGSLIRKQMYPTDKIPVTERCETTRGAS